MNERIRELAEQAAKKHGHTIKFSPEITETLDSFAELIVRECVKVVDDMADPEDSERYFWAIQNAIEKIKQHFGVEE